MLIWEGGGWGAVQIHRQSDVQMFSFEVCRPYVLFSSSVAFLKKIMVNMTIANDSK